MSIRQNYRHAIGHNRQVSVTRMQKLRDRAMRWTARLEERRQGWIEKRAARIARYREAFRGAWLTRIGLGMLAIVQAFFAKTPFELTRRTAPVAPYAMMGLPFGLKRKNKKRRKVDHKPRFARAALGQLVAETLEQRQMLAADAFADATVLPSTPSVVETGTLAGTTLESGEFTPQFTSQSGWLEWTAPSSGVFQANIIGTDGLFTDTTLAVFENVLSLPTTGADLVESDDDGGPGFFSSLEFNATVGSTYHFQLGDWGSVQNGGPYEFTISPSGLGPASEATVEAIDTNPAEPGGVKFNGQFRINLDGVAPAGGVTVTYSMSGSASEGDDYDAVSSSGTPGSVFIPEGFSFASVDINVIDDPDYEGPEDATLTITSVTGTGVVAGAADSATVTIDDDEVPTVAVITGSDDVDTEDTDTGSFTITLTDGSGNPQPAGETVEIAYTIGGTAAPGSDHSLVSGVTTIAAGDLTATLAITGLVDTLIEADETVTLTLDSIVSLGAPLPGIDVDTATASATIIDDDANTVEISTVLDGTEPGAFGVDDAVIELALTDATVLAQDDIEITLAASPSGSLLQNAIYGDDYYYVTNAPQPKVPQTAGNDSLANAQDVDGETFSVASDGAINDSTTVPHITIDGIGEGTTAFYSFTLQPGETAQLDVDLAGSPPPPDFDNFLELFDSSGTSVATSTGTLMFTNSGSTAEVYTVEVSDETGSPGDPIPTGATYDFHISLTAPPVPAVPPTLIIPGGAPSATVPILVINDDVLEPTEDVELTIDSVTNPGDVTIVASPDDSTVVEITDDDSATVDITAGPVASEGSPAVPSAGQSANAAVDTSFTVTLSQPSDSGTSVLFSANLGQSFALPNDTHAEYGVDYILSGPDVLVFPLVGAEEGTAVGEIVFPAGETVRTINVEVLSESLAEALAGETEIELTEAIEIELFDGAPIPGFSTSNILGDDDITLGTAAATASIEDDDTAKVRLQALISAASEPGGVGNDGRFQVQLTLPDSTATPTVIGAIASTDTVIPYNIVTPNTATPGDDYVTLTGVVTIPAGQSTATIDVEVLDDDVLEPTETVSVEIIDTLADPITGDPDIELDTVPSNLTDTVFIADDDQLTVTITGVTDGQEDVANVAGPDATDGQFVVSISGLGLGDYLGPAGDATQPVVIAYSVIPGTGAADEGIDYQSLSGTVTINVQTGATTATIDIDVIDDFFDETDETVTIQLDSVTSQTPIGAGGAGVVIDSVDTDSIEIIDDEVGVVSIGAFTPAAEPNQDGTLFFTLSESSPFSTTVTYVINSFDTDSDPGDSGTGQTLAIAGDDHNLTSGTVTFLPNSTVATVSVPVLNDGDVEGLEVIPVEITGFTANPAGYGINSNDDPIGVDFSGPSSRAELPILADQTVDIAVTSNAVEGSVDGEFTVSIETPSLSPTVISYTVTTPGATLPDATEGSDYASLSGTVTIDAGETTATIDIDVTGAPFDDMDLEGLEYVTLTLDSVTNATDPDITIATPSPEQATLSITDGDKGFVNVAAVNDGEENNPGSPVDGKFRVTLYNPDGSAAISADTDTVITYSVAVANGAAAGTTAATGADFITLSGVVTIDAGQTGADIDVTILEDNLVESDMESITVTLTGITAGDPQLGLGSVSGPTLTFRQGENLTGSSTPYTGTQDTFLDGSATGAVNGGDNQTRVDGNGARQGLLRFDDLFGGGMGQIPDGALADTEISLANLQYTVFNSGPFMNLHQLLVGFDESVDTWDTLVDGVTVVDGEISTGSDLLGGGSGANTHPVTDELQDWLDGTASNFGWAFLTTAGNDIRFRSSEFGGAGNVNRPELQVNLDLSATINIIDDDAATVEIGSVTAGDEPGGALGTTAGDANAGVATFTLTNPVSTPVYVQYSVTDGSATGGSDYVPTSGTVTIAAGDLSADLLIEVLNDNLAEGTEDVVVTITGIDYTSPNNTDPQVTLGGNLVENVDINDNDQGVLSVIDSGDGAENNGGTPTNGEFTFITSVASDEATVINYSLGGSAVNGTDYATLSGVITLPASDPSVTLSVDVLEDMINEDVEDVVLTIDSISPSGNIVLGASDTATVDIADDDDLLVTIEATDPTATEGADDGELTIKLNFESDEDVQVDYSVLLDAIPGLTPGIFGVGDDYVPLPGTTAGSNYLDGQITIPAGDMEFVLPVQPYQDFFDEMTEDVTVNLDSFVMLEPGTANPGNNTNVSFGATTSDTVEILDEVFDVTIAKTDSPAAELGPPAPDVFNGQFTITMTNDLPVDTVVQVNLLSSTAQIGQDFVFDTANPTSPVQFVTIPASSNPGPTSVTLTVLVLDDSLSEATEFINVQVVDVNPSGSLYDSLTGIGSPNTATESILDNDGATVTISAVNGTEPGINPVGPSIGDDGQFVFTRDVDSAFDTFVEYSIVASATDATAGVDYDTITSGTAVIPAGTINTATLLIDVFDDFVVEGDESVTLQIDDVTSGGTNVVGGSGSATATIFDDENALVSVDPVNDGLEPSNDGFFRVSQSFEADSDTVISYTVQVPAADDAQPGAAPGALTGPGVIDYESLSGTVTIAAGDTTALIAVNPFDDNMIEDLEGVTITLDGITSSSSGTTSGVSVDGSDDTAEVFIASDDEGLVTIAPGVDGVENSVNPTFVVSIDTVSDQPTVIDYAISGTAANLGDITSVLPGQVTIDAFATTATITIDLVNDFVGEPTEDLTVTLTGIDAAGTGGDNESQISLGGSTSATVSVLDDDVPALAVSDPTVNEDDGTVEVTVTLNVGTQDGFTVDYATVNDTAFANGTGTNLQNDFGDATDDSGSGTDGKLEFAGNMGESYTITIPITDGAGESTGAGFGIDVVEATEQFTVELSNLAPDSASTGPVDITDDGTVTIIDDDTMTFTVADVTIDEEPGLLTFEVVASNPSDIDFDLDVFYTTPDGDAPNSPGLNTTDAEGNDFALFGGLFQPPLPADTDYDSGTDEVTFTAGDFGATGAQPVTVEILDDDLVEGGLTNDPGWERFLANLDVTTDAVDIDGRSFDDSDTAIGQIDDVTGGVADSATALLSVTDGTAQEPSDDGQFLVTLSAPSSYDVMIPYTVEVAADSATPGDDYVTLSGVVTVLAGETTATIDVTVADETPDLLEDDEFVRITLDDPIAAGNADPNVSIDPASGTEEVAIFDDDTALVSIVANDPDAAEETSAGVDDGQFTVTLSEESDTDTVVTYSVSGTATNGADYATLSGTVTIDAGDLTATIDVDVTDDLVSGEGPETVILTLTGATPGGVTNADVSVDSSADTATVTIDESDGDIFVVVEAVEDGGEFNDPATPADEVPINGSFVFKLVDGAGNPINAPAGGVLISYTPGGTATGDDDYVSLNNLELINAGSSSEPLTISVLEDQLVEGAETVTISINGATFFSGGFTTPPPGTTGVLAVDPTVAEITIEDDDVISFTTDELVFGEGDALVSIPVTLDKELAPSAGPVTVTVNYTDFNTSFGDDYLPFGSQDLTFPAGSAAGTTLEVDVAILEDSDVEGFEAFAYSLTSSYAGPGDIDLGSPSTVTIADNDSGGPLQVTDVKVTSDDWTPAFLDAVDPDSQGYSIPTGNEPDQIRGVPWANVNTLIVTMSDDIDPSTVSVAAVNVYATRGTDPVVTDVSVVGNQLFIELNDPASDGGDLIRNAYRLEVLDSVSSISGEFLEGSFTRGDALPSVVDGDANDDFNFEFRVLPGDIDQSGVTNALDPIPLFFGGIFATPGDAGYSIMTDTDGNGIQNSFDAIAVFDSDNILKAAPGTFPGSLGGGFGALSRGGSGNSGSDDSGSGDVRSSDGKSGDGKSGDLVLGGVRSWSSDAVDSAFSDYDDDDKGFGLGRGDLF